MRRTSSWVAIPILTLLITSLMLVPASAENPCTNGWTAFGADVGNTGVPTSPLDNTLTEAWQYKADGDIYGTPMVAQGRLVFGTGNGTVVCLDPLTGDEYWQAPLRAGIESSPAFVYLIRIQQNGNLSRCYSGGGVKELAQIEEALGKPPELQIKSYPRFRHRIQDVSEPARYLVQAWITEIATGRGGHAYSTNPFHKVSFLLRLLP